MLVSALLVHLAWLVRFPAMNPDEGQGMNWMLTWWHGTWATQSMDRIFILAPYEIDGPHGLSELAALELLGVGTLQIRLVALLWGIGLLGITYLLGRLLYGLTEARLAVLFLALSYPFFLSAHLFRPDIGLAVIGFASLALFLIGRRQAWANFVAGLLIPIGQDIHLNAGAYGVGLALLYLVTYRTSIWRRREAWLFAFGVICGGLFVLGYVAALGMFHERIETLGFSLGASKQPPIFAMSLMQAFAGEAVVHTLVFLREAPMDTLLLLLTLVWALARRRQEDRPLLWMGLGMFIYFALLVRTKTEFYLILWYPLIVLLLASALPQVARSARWMRPQSAFIVFVLIVCVGLAQNRFASQIWNWRNYDPSALNRVLSNTVPPGAAVVGQPTYWMALRDHPYFNWWSISSLWQKDHTTIAQLLERYHVDALIVDTNTRLDFTPIPEGDSFWKPIMDPILHPSPMPGTLEMAMGGRYRLAFQGHFEGHGIVEIWLRE